MMIYEREIHFTDEQFNNEQYFPNVLIVRKAKSAVYSDQQDLRSVVSSLKSHVTK